MQSAFFLQAPCHFGSTAFWSCPIFLASLDFFGWGTYIRERDNHWHWHSRFHGNPRARNSASGLGSTQQRRTRLLPFSTAVASHYLSGRLRLLPLLPLSAALASHYLSGRLRPASAFRCPCLPLSQWEAQAFRASAFRCPCLPLSQWEAQAFRCFRLPLPLPPTISVGGSGLPLLPLSAALASHYLRLSTAAMRNLIATSDLTVTSHKSPEQDFDGANESESQ